MFLVKTLTETDSIVDAKEALEKLSGLLISSPFRKEDLGQESSGCIQSLTRVAARWGQEDDDIARLFCTIVALLNKSRDDPADVANRETLGRLGTCQMVAQLLVTWEETSEPVAAACFEAIFTLARDEGNRKRFGAGGVCESVSRALERWGKTSQDTGWAGCKAALNLACDETNQALLGAAGACNHIVGILAKYGPTVLEIAWDGSWAVSNLAFEHTNRCRLGSAGAIQALNASLKAWPESREVALNVSCALHNLAYAKENFDLMRDSEICTTVVDLLDRFPNDEELLESILWTIWVLAFHPYNETILTSHRVLSLISRTLQTTGRTNRIIAWHGCGAIWAIFCSYVSTWQRSFTSEFTSLLKREIAPAVRGSIWNGMQNEARQVCFELLTADAALRLKNAKLQAVATVTTLFSNKPVTPALQSTNNTFSRDVDIAAGDAALQSLVNLRRSILFRACVQEDWGAAGLLLEICSREELDYINGENGWTVLHAAVYNNGPLWLVRRCMDAMDPTRVDNRGASVIFTACARDVNPSLLELLLKDSRLDARKSTTMGWTPLHVAAFLRGRRETFELLVQYGARDSPAASSKTSSASSSSRKEAGVALELDISGMSPGEDHHNDDDDDGDDNEDTAASKLSEDVSSSVPTVLQLVASAAPIRDLQVVRLLLLQAGSRIDRETMERAVGNHQLPMLEYLMRVQILTSLLVVYCPSARRRSTVSKGDTGTNGEIVKLRHGNSRLKMIPRDLIKALSRFLYGPF